ncbi:MAG: winged helix-turn-helix domain-containing protein [Pseudomonadota bacterium]
MIYLFGSCRLDTARRVLERHGAPVHVEPQVFDLICYLVQNSGRAISKDEIFDAIWKGRAISDAVLTTRIRGVRRAIDDAGSDSMVRTIHRVGYEFLPKVTSPDGVDLMPAPSATMDAYRADSEVFELRQVIVAAFQPRLALNKPFDPDRLDRLVSTIRNQLPARLLGSDAIEESIDGTIFAVIGVTTAYAEDVMRAARLALDFADTASAGDARIAVGLGTGTIARSSGSLRGEALLQVTQTVGRASTGQVLLSQQILPHLPPQAVTAPAGDMVRLLELADKPHAVPEESKFVGRLVELGLMQSAVQAMGENGSGGCITLEGAAGVGKSRMVGRAVEMVRAVGGREIIAFSREISADGVLHRNIMRGLNEIADQDRLPKKAMPAAARALLEDAPGEPSIGRAVQHSNNLLQAIVGILRDISRHDPLLIVLEDTHWIDGESRRLAIELAEICSEMQVILMITARPSARAFLDEIATAARGDIVSLSLGPLSARQSRTLIDRLAPEIEATVADQLVARSDGNPLFLTRLIEAYQARGSASFDYVPGTIQSVVQVQFDQLPDSQKAALRQLAILGERFERQVAEILFGAEMLEAAVTPGFLQSLGRWMKFSHNLVRESIYASIPKADRLRGHTEAARTLVPYDPLLAAEHAMLGDLSVAPSICVQVARDTFHFRRHGRSVELIEQATRLDCTANQRAQLEVFLGSAKVDLGHEAAAMEHYEDAAARAENAVPAVFALVRMARLHCRYERLDRASTALDRADDWLSRDPGPGYLASEVADARSLIAWHARDPIRAIREGESAVAVSDHPHATGRALIALGWGYFSNVQFDKASEIGDRGLQLVEDKQLRLVEPDILAPALRFRWYHDPVPARLDDANAFVDRADQIGIRLARMQTRAARLEIAWELNDTSTVLDDLAALEEEVTPNDRLTFATMRFFEALHAIRQGDEPDQTKLIDFTHRGAAPAFSPVFDLVEGPSGERPASPTPLEQLWHQRLSGNGDALRPSGPSDPAKAWKTFAQANPLRTGQAGT